jgi:carbon-monoxide dehydrogenase small subunit
VHTVESLANGGELDPLQRSFAENLGLRCWYRTPGMLLTATGAAGGNPSPTAEEMRGAVSGTLCGCAGYDGTVQSSVAGSPQEGAVAGAKR